MTKRIVLVNVNGRQTIDPAFEKESDLARLRYQPELRREVHRQAMRPSTRKPMPTGYNPADTPQGEPF